MKWRHSPSLFFLGALFAGVGIGVGAFTFIYAQGGSYLTNDPLACANCHVMNDQYAGWVKGSHRMAAVCNDCHTPPGFLGKYATKAENGFWHSFAFTTGWFPDNIQMHERNRRVTEEACQKCHQDMIEAVDGPHQRKDRIGCITCHRSVGHLEQ